MSWANKGLRIKRFMEDCGGANGAAEKLRDILTEDKKAKAEIMQEFSLRECAEQLRRPGFEDVSLRHGNVAEAVDVTAFTVITGELLSTKIMDAYTEAPHILDELVRPFNSKLQTDRIPGVYSEGTMEELEPGEPYQETADIKEKYVTVQGKKRGLILSVTEEAVLFDQTGQVMLSAERIGEHCQTDREVRGLYTIMDISVSGKTYYCWYPSGSRAAVWANAGGSGDAHEFDNLIVDTLTDYTDINAADVALGLMKDEAGRNIIVPATTLLVPRTLNMTARRIINNVVLPGGANTEVNPFQNAAKVLNSPIIDGCGDGNATTNWWWGDFKKQFVNKVIYPMQVLRRKFSDNHDPAFERDIIGQWKAREYSQVGAVEYRYVIKSTGAGS